MLMVARGAVKDIRPIRDPVPEPDEPLIKKLLSIGAATFLFPLLNPEGFKHYL